jgi:hypothetical protein
MDTKQLRPRPRHTQASLSGPGAAVRLHISKQASSMKARIAPCLSNCVQVIELLMIPTNRLLLPMLTSDTSQDMPIMSVVRCTIACIFDCILLVVSEPSGFN